MISVGLTGGIGSGKSVVRGVWEKLGACTVDSDQLAKELMEGRPELKKSIRSAFGEASYFPDGSLNRAHLANEAFLNNRAEELNSIVHPAVRSSVNELRNSAEKEGYPVFVQEAAILLNRGRPPGFDYIVLVTAPIDDRIRWIQNRSTLSKKEILNRMRSQMEDDQLAALSDYCIVNDSTLEQLEQESAKLYRKLLGSKPGNQS